MDDLRAYWRESETEKIDLLNKLEHKIKGTKYKDKVVIGWDNENLKYRPFVKVRSTC